MTDRSTVPPITDIPCSDAFRAARDEVRQLRSFSAPTLAIMETLAQSVLAPEELVPPTAAWLINLGYRNDMVNGVKTYTKLKPGILLEKLASDIAWDMGLPHVSYGLVKNDLRDNLSLCIEPAPAALSLDEIESGSIATFMRNKPQLAPALSTLAVFDYWLHVSDRHQGNLVVYPNTTGTDLALTGIDLNGAKFFEAARPSPYEGMTAACRIIADKASSSAIEATLTAIETYPAQRLAQLSQRLLSQVSPHSWEGQTVEGAPAILQHRRTSLRADVARLFPKLRLDRKVFAAPKLAA